jgi:hypothetical protein
MMLLRYPAPVVLVLALAAGCSQSLFDDGVGDDGNGGPGPVPDAREGTPDADLTISDADPTRPDADPTRPDADVTPPPDASDGCTGECVDDDSYDDFNGDQGGTNGRWRYVEFRPEEDSYVDMAPAELDGMPGFIGTGTPAPSLARCADTMPVGLCSDLTRMLALTTTAPGAHHPALLWTAPADGTYTVSVVYRVPPDAPAIPATMMLTRNNQSTVLDFETLGPIGTLNAAPELTAGDVVVISAITDSDTIVSVGLGVLIHGPR